MKNKLINKGESMFNKKQNKLILECIEHFESWESNMGRAEEKIIKTHSFLGRVDKIITYVPTNKMIQLNKIKQILNKERA